MSGKSLRPLTLPARQATGFTYVAGTLRVPSQRHQAAKRSVLPLRHTECAYYTGFTLVELLVVITIIAILASLLVVAATAAMNRARFARIKLEIDSINQGMETYRDKAGGDYPPNAITHTSNGMMKTLTGNATPTTVTNDLVRHFKKVAPRSRESEVLIRGLAGADMSSINGTTNDGNPVLEGGLSPSEALVFWLNGFSSDPKAPITGTGGPAYQMSTATDVNGGVEGRTPVFPFEVPRLGPRNDDGSFAGRWIQFQLQNGGPTYRINLWQCYPPNSTQPLVYFDTSRPLMDVEPQANPGQHVHAIKQLDSASTSAGTPSLRYANDGKFQILHCGLDDAWGDFSKMSIIDTTDVTQLLLFPTGPFTLDLADTVTNFTDSNLEDAQP